jgi:hypothetical protein
MVDGVADPVEDDTEDWLRPQRQAAVLHVHRVDGPSVLARPQRNDEDLTRDRCEEALILIASVSPLRRRSAISGVSSVTHSWRGAISMLPTRHQVNRLNQVFRSVRATAKASVAHH